MLPLEQARPGRAAAGGPPTRESTRSAARRRCRSSDSGCRVGGQRPGVDDRERHEHGHGEPVSSQAPDRRQNGHGRMGARLDVVSIAACRPRGLPAPTRPQRQESAQAWL